MIELSAHVKVVCQTSPPGAPSLSRPHPGLLVEQTPGAARRYTHAHIHEEIGTYISRYHGTLTPVNRDRSTYSEKAITSVETTTESGEEGPESALHTVSAENSPPNAQKMPGIRNERRGKG